MAFHTNKRKYVYNYTQVTLKAAIKISAFEYLKLYALVVSKASQLTEGQYLQLESVELSVALDSKQGCAAW